MIKFSTCVVLAAGRGTRMGGDTPKVLLPIAGKSALEHVVDYWKPYSNSFLFVLGYKYDLVVQEITRLGLKHYEIVIQHEQKGIAHALLHTEDYILPKSTFVVALGDCLNIGTFEFPINLNIGYGLWTSNYHQQLGLCCSAWLDGNSTISRIVEKGRAPYVGIGTYFLDKRVFHYIKDTPPSAYRSEIEITEVLQNMIDAGERLSPVFLHGDFINLTYPEDIKRAEELLTKGTLSL